MNMEEVLYANFLSDKRVYNLAQSTWKRLFERLAEKHSFTFVPYINQIQNGRKEYDGNPIFSAYVASVGRAVRIIQAEPEEGGSFFSAWLDTIELQEGRPPMQELVIDIALSRESKKRAERLVKGWLAEGWGEKEIANFSMP